MEQRRNLPAVPAERGRGRRRDLLQRAIVDNPPVVIRDGGVIAPGYDDELDELCTLATDADVTAHYYDDLYHEIYNEPEQDRVLDDLVACCEPKWMEIELDYRLRGGIQHALRRGEVLLQLSLGAHSEDGRGHAGAGADPGQQLVQYEGDEEHPLGFSQVRDGDDGDPRLAVRGPQEAAHVERLSL